MAWLLHNGLLSLVRYRRHASTRIKYRQIVSEVAPFDAALDC